MGKFFLLLIGAMALFITACEEVGEETQTNSQTVSEPSSGPEPKSSPEVDYSTECEKLTIPFEYTDTDLYRDAKVIKAIRYTEEQTQQREMGSISELRESIELGEFDYNAGEKVLVLNMRRRKRLFDIATGYTQSGAMEAAACYIPRHLVVFEDEASKPLALMEICLQCSQMKVDNNLLSPKCGDQWRAYKVFFMSIDLN